MKNWLLSTLFVLFLVGCGEPLPPHTHVTWCIPSDCHASHACGPNSTPVNGLVPTTACHAGHACYNEYGRVTLPIGIMPTLDDYQRVLDGEIYERGDHLE